MPSPAIFLNTPRDLLEMVRAAAQAADRAYGKTGVPFYGREYRNLMAEYNQLVSVAARLIDEEATRLYPPYILSLIPSPHEIEPTSWHLHLQHVARSLNHFALYLESQLEPEPVVAEN